MAGAPQLPNLISQLSATEAWVLTYLAKLPQEDRLAGHAAYGSRLQYPFAQEVASILVLPPEQRDTLVASPQAKETARRLEQSVQRGGGVAP